MNKLVAACLLAVPTLAASPISGLQQPEIMVLGTYHMANPGRDVHNMTADDVLSPERQAEIQDLMDVLERFNPTKIAVEAQVGSSRIADRYANYVAGEYSLSRNEIDQIGLRLAARLGHETVYAVDEDGEFPYLRVRNYARANGLEHVFDSISAAAGAGVEQLGEFLRTHTVLEVLTHLNADSSVARGVAGYYAFVPFGEPYEYAGPDLLARWFERNIRIYHNIRALVTSPEDRILVVYGAGHTGWLQQNIEDDPSVRLRNLQDLIR